MISEGVGVAFANTWQAGGQTGSGVKLGIIDVGFQGLPSLLGTELPASVTARCYTGIGFFRPSRRSAKHRRRLLLLPFTGPPLLKPSWTLRPGYRSTSQIP